MFENKLDRWMLAICLTICGSSALAQEPKVKKSGKENMVKPVFAFVALNKLTSPTSEQVRKGLEAALPKEHKVDDIKVDDKSVSFAIDGQQAMYVFIDKPIPWADLEGICKSSWIWTEATKSLKNHPAHLLVVLQGQKGTHLERSVLLTKMLSAASRTFNTAGVYWGHGSVVLSPAQIQKMAADASKDEPPLLAWISFHRQKLPDGAISVVTEGLDYFDCMEVEVVNSKVPAAKVLNAVMGLAYITIKGEVIKDGDTIGSDAEEKIKTHYAPSVRDKRTQAIRIDL